MRYPNAREVIVPESGSCHNHLKLCRITLGGVGAEKHAKHRAVAII